METEAVKMLAGAISSAFGRCGFGSGENLRSITKLWDATRCSWIIEQEIHFICCDRSPRYFRIADRFLSGFRFKPVIRTKGYLHVDLEKRFLLWWLFFSAGIARWKIHTTCWEAAHQAADCPSSILPVAQPDFLAGRILCHSLYDFFQIRFARYRHDSWKQESPISIGILPKPKLF